jgi:bacillolysin
MNEAYADYFGNAVDVTVSGTAMDDPDAGEIAEDLCRVPQPDNWKCPLRDLNDGRGVEDYGFYLVDFDNGGVHLNSTIFSGALWDIREGLEPDFADQIMYRALTITPALADFVDGRNAIVLAAEQLLATPEQLDVIDEAFDQKQIIEGWDDSPAESDSKSLLEDVSPLGFYNAAPQVSGSRYVVGTYGDKELMFEVPQKILVGNVSGSGSPVKVNNNGGANVLYDELPDISGKEVVWARGEIRGNKVSFDIFNRRLGGGMRTIADTSAFDWFPSIDGNLIAWERLGAAGTDVWARRIGGLPKRITRNGRDELYPQVSGTKIAWWDSRADRFGIKDFKTGKKTIIRHSNPNAFLGPPALNDTHVFWFQDVDNDGFGAIMRAKLNGKAKKTLVRASDADVAPFYKGLTPEPPRISANGNYLVYAEEFGYDRAADPENVGRDVWHLPVSGGTPRVVTCNRGDQAYASIGNGRRAVWLDGSLGRTDVMTRAEPRTTCQRTLTRG